MTLLSMNRGDSPSWSIALTDLDTGVPIDLTTMTLVFTAKRRVSDADDDPGVILKTEGDGITIDDDPSTGLAVLVIDPGDTASIDYPRTLRWDLEVDNGAGDVRTPLHGRLAISADVTRGSGS